MTFLGYVLVSDDTLAASLNYWAAWCGDDSATYHSDDFMVGDLGTWRGNVLLVSLINSLDTTTAYPGLCIRAVWTLLARRPQLLSDDLAAFAELRNRVDAPRDVVNGARSDLEQISYILKWKG